LRSGEGKLRRDDTCVEQDGRFAILPFIIEKLSAASMSSTRSPGSMPAPIQCEARDFRLAKVNRTLSVKLDDPMSGSIGCDA
jgi:hypothetical protein